ALDELAADPELIGRCVHREVLPERPARYQQLAEPLHPEVAARIAARGIDQLYAHQAAAIDALRDRRSVVVATGTASGKSLCYQTPIVSSVVEGRRDTALLIFPTKALAQDQLRALRSWLVPGLRAVTYDGDPAGHDRQPGRAGERVVRSRRRADRRRRVTARRTGARVLAATAARRALGCPGVGERRGGRAPDPLRPFELPDPRVHSQPARRRSRRP